MFNVQNLNKKLNAKISQNTNAVGRSEQWISRRTSIDAADLHNINA